MKYKCLSVDVAVAAPWTQRSTCWPGRMSGLVKQRRDLVAAIGVGILSLGNMAVPKVRRWRSETRRGLEPFRSQVRPSVTFTEAGWDGGPSAIKRAPFTEKSTGVPKQEWAIYKP